MISLLGGAVSALLTNFYIKYQQSYPQILWVSVTGLYINRVSILNNKIVHNIVVW